MPNKSLVLIGSLLTGSLLFANISRADNGVMLEVTITNLTHGQPLAPVLVATHEPGVAFFEEGEAPSDELAWLAEAGNGQPMADYLWTLEAVDDVQISTGGLTFPGDSTTVQVWAQTPNDHISVGSMLGATNDAFFAIKDLPLPTKGTKTVTYMASAYDAGSETNDELATTVAGLGGEAYSPNDSGEGFVHIHSGIHGIGDADPAVLDWRNPVARIIVNRVK
ncbi:MAG: spondin domain-containing protein [Gammaproteobacteria bacterium]|nr:spondin domain-containing protein [Pseudomonadales bacterium]MCP5349264.1 spondin domain-containing protein [Pseudomonadales bacterium]